MIGFRRRVCGSDTDNCKVKAVLSRKLESAGMPYHPVADIPEEATADCEAIAYEFTGAVQPHAALIVLETRSKRILQVSQSIFGILQSPSERLLNATFTPELIGSVSQLNIPWKNLEAGQLREFRSQFKHKQTSENLLLRIHGRGNRTMVSLEPASLEIDISENQIAQLLPALLESFSLCNTVHEAAESIAEAVRGAIGYDRSIVYRFDEDWNGEVIAESSKDDTERQFLGLKFPASDIPQSARRLYENCRVRHVLDTQAAPSTLEPLLDPLTQRHTDLSQLAIRSSAASCREYYGNMKVRSTCVLPVLVSGKVWGHISCFNSTPQRIPAYCERTLHAAAQAFSQKVAAADLQQCIEAERTALKVQHDLAMKHRVTNEQSDPLLDSVKSLMTLLKADHACLILESGVISAGSPIPSPLISNLLQTLRAKSIDRPFWSDKLRRDLPNLELHGCDVAGVLAVPLNPMWDEAILLLRKNRDESIAWAGNPREGLRWDKAGRPGMRPRTSFAAYLAKTQDSSTPWLEDEILIAKSCTMVLGLQLLRMKAQDDRKAQESFLANMSHEIRTPMTSILGYIDLLEEDALDEQQTKEAIAIIRNNGNHLLNVINDILDFSKIHTGQLPLESCAVSPRELLSEVLGMLSHQAEPRKTKLSVQIGKSVPEAIYSDPTRLRQILVNLVSNAIKFTEQGTVDIAVDFDRVGASLNVRVRDTGIGMNETQLNAIREFRPFRQADVSTTREFGGTGLGLAICKCLVELLGGTIDIQSQKNVGSTFSFTIKDQAEMRNEADALHPQAVADKPSVVSTRPNKQSTVGKLLAGLQILLVEDGIDNQRLLKFVLSRAGADVMLAENGKVAIEIVEAEHSKARAFDIILMDLQMPVMDGYEATRQLRKTGYTKPIIALSAHAVVGSREQSLSAGCDDYCTKPIDRAELFRICSDWANR